MNERSPHKPSVRRKRPHPAKRARLVTGVVSAVTVVGLTGCMAATGAANGNQATANGSSVASASSDASSSSQVRSFVGAAGGRAGTSTQPVTSSHGS